MSDGAHLPVSEWLQSIKLDQYSDLFEKNDLRAASDLQQLTDDFLLHLGIHLPGHRKRILASLHKSAESERPVPRKRNVFVTAQAPGPNVEPPPEEKTRSVCSPPPIPPRVTRVPPLRFSTTPPESISPISLPDPAQEEELPSFCPSPFTPDAFGYSDHDEDVEEPPKVVAPPLPLKRHKVPETKSRTPPPIPVRPPKPIPPAPSSPPPSTDETKASEDHPGFPLFSAPKPLPRVFPRETPTTPAQPPPRDVFSGLHKPEIMDNDTGTIYEFHKDIDGIVLTGFRRLKTDDDVIEHGADDYDDAQSIVRSDSDLSTRRSSSSLSSGISSSHSLSGNMEDGEVSAQQPTIIKAGWLDKNPPQGSYIFQRRWVKLDTDYLRYYDSDKDVYSKRIIKTSAIAKVASMGDQKFEVAVSNRNFMFRAESDAERNDWMKAVQQILDERRMKVPHSTPSLTLENPDKCGLLEMKGCKPRLFVAVAADKVYLYKNAEDFHSGVGITSIEMNVGNVKEVDKRSFDLTTPYKTFSFVADSEQDRGDWVEAMMQCVAGALSNLEVAMKIWSLEANRRCADCDAPNPDWASINLCVVICKKCAGEHRSLGPNISKVRSLKMDNKIWTDDLIQLFLNLGNEVSNKFWAANVPPSEAVTAYSGVQERKTFITAKYREGKYRRYHQLFGNQAELNKALCISVTTSDLTETQALVFCGADIGGDFFSQLLESAQQTGQRLQEEFLKQIRTSEAPRLDLGTSLEKKYYIMHHSITHNGYLYKTSSMSKLVTDRKAREEFSRRWCVLNDGVLSYYENMQNNSPNGEIRMDEIVCVAVIPPETHGYDSAFEIYTKSERLYLFAAERPEEAREWVKSITKCFLPPKAEELLSYDFDRIGRLQFKGGRSLERVMVGWFSLCKTNLYTYVEENETVEVINLKKLSELSTKDKDILVLGEGGRIIYMQGERKLDFSGWMSAIQKASSTSGDTLSAQQLTNSDVPCIVEKCIDHISRFGVESEGIYRKSGQKSKITGLLEALNKDARSVVFKDEEPVDNVSDTLKRFFRDIGEGVFAEHCMQWLQVTEMEDERKRIRHYQELLAILPPVNRATLKALTSHLVVVQHFSDVNQMNVHNLAIVFGPTLFQTDGQNYKPGQVVEDLITFYLEIFNVDVREHQKQLDIASTIMKVQRSQTKPRGSDFICSVYLREKKPECEQSVHIAVTMTAQELVETLLERRNITPKDGEYWSCVEVDTAQEIERPLHFSEKVLPIFHTRVSSTTYLVVKEDPNMDAMLFYIKNRVGDSKNGNMRFRGDKSRLDVTNKFHPRYFMLNDTTLRMYREIRSHRPEKEWEVKNLTVYLGVKKKITASTGWGFTVISKNEKNEKSQWYLCCDTVGEMRQWLGAFMFAQHGSLWPEESSLVRTRNSRQDPSLGNRSLIPIRGTEMDIRRSMAAFTADPLTLLGNV